MSKNDEPNHVDPLILEHPDGATAVFVGYDEEEQWLSEGAYIQLEVDGEEIYIDTEEALSIIAKLHELITTHG